MSSNQSKLVIIMFLFQPTGKKREVKGSVIGRGKATVKISTVYIFSVLVFFFCKVIMQETVRCEENEIVWCEGNGILQALATYIMPMITKELHAQHDIQNSLMNTEQR